MVPQNCKVASGTSAVLSHHNLCLSCWNFIYSIVFCKTLIASENVLKIKLLNSFMENTNRKQTKYETAETDIYCK